MVSIHCDSRGLGHQIEIEYLPVLEQVSRKYDIPIRRKGLVCAPIGSNEGRNYISAVACDMNYSYANRQVIAHLVGETFERVLPEAEVKQIWDHIHNSARFERRECAKRIRTPWFTEREQLGASSQDGKNCRLF